MSQFVALLAEMPSPSVLSFVLFGIGMVVLRLVMGHRKASPKDR